MTARLRLRLLLLLGSPLAALCIGLCACGGSSDPNAAKSAAEQGPGAVTSADGLTLTSSYIPPGQKLRGDGDADNPSDIDGNGDVDSAKVGGSDNDNDSFTAQSYRFPDGDDRASFAYGQAVGPTERRAIAAVVERFYRAAAARDGGRACSLLTPSLARSAVRGYGHGSPGPAYLSHARTCRELMSTIFERSRAETSEAITVVDVRTLGNVAQVIFGSRKMPASQTWLERTGSSWRLEQLTARALP